MRNTTLNYNSWNNSIKLCPSPGKDTSWLNYYSVAKYSPSMKINMTVCILLYYSCGTKLQKFKIMFFLVSESVLSISLLWLCACSKIYQVIVILIFPILPIKFLHYMYIMCRVSLSVFKDFGLPWECWMFRQRFNSKAWHLIVISILTL